MALNHLISIATPVDKSKLLSSLRLAEFYITSGNYEKASTNRNLGMELFRQLGADNDLNTISMLHKVSHAYSEKGMYKEAIETESLLVNVFPHAQPNNKHDYALYLNDLSFYLMGDDKIELAADYINKALSLIENTKDVNLAIIYIRAAEIFSDASLNRLDLSIEYQNKALASYALSYGKASPMYLDELWYLAGYYELSQCYDKACNAYLEIMHTRADDENESGMESFLPLLDKIIFCSRKINNTERVEQCKQIAYMIKLQSKEYHKAKYTFPDFPSINDSLEYESLSDKIYKFHEEIDSDDELGENIRQPNYEKIGSFLSSLPNSYGKAYSLSTETLRHSLSLDWTNTIYYGIEALKAYDALGVITDEYVMTLCCIAEAYSSIDNPAKAYDYILKAFELRDDYLSSDNIYYDGIPNDLALYCSQLGNYNDAIKYGTMAVEDKEYQIYSDLSFGYFNSLCNLASYYGALGHHEIELEILQNLVERAEEIDPSILEFPESGFLYNLASSYTANGHHEKAIEIGLKVKDIREQYGYKKTISNIYLLLGRVYRRTGELHAALDYALKANELLREIGYNDNLSLSHSYDLLAIIYRDLDEHVEAEKMERLAMQVTHSNIVNNFADLSSYDRTSYWDKHYDLFTIWYPNYFLRSKIKDASELYNKSALFAKGLLLNADTEILTLINDSGDQMSLRKYRQLLNNRYLLSKFEVNDAPESINYVDSLTRESHRLERELMQECRAFGDYTQSMKLTWHDVQDALGPDDVAIEFLSFPLVDENDNLCNNDIYMALLVRKHDPSPHFIVLCDGTQLYSENETDIYNKNTYKLIWEPLNKFISGMKNVYFSPAGKLHNINIEVLPQLVNKNKNVNFYRLSSTRALTLDNNVVSSGGAVLYGGLKYDASVSDLVVDSQSYNNSRMTRFSGEIDKLNMRSGMQYLKGTLTEVKSIQSSFDNEEIHTLVYTGREGTEASFKSLDGQSNKFIHIATHGFYYSDRDSLEMRNTHLDYLSNQISTSNRSYAEDYSLSRSGLLMAGCDNILHGEILPNNVEDGVLFSREIANLNFKNAELITLSACETGLGDITGEGVFGLQRAFKKAGVQSILMSLWKVDDNATNLLMTKFYENYLTKNLSKIDSLKDAQQFVRSFNGGIYDDPKFWAAFIILDAL